MSPFVLFLALVAHGSGGVTSAEFSSEDACETARSIAVIEFGKRSGAVIAFCTPKDARD